jgi:hypothetical protein
MPPLAPYTAGGSTCGSEEPLSGRVRDIAAYDGGLGGAELRFKVESTNPTSVAGYVDGLLSRRLPENVIDFAVSGLTPGTHTLSLLPFETDTAPPLLELEPLGQRTRLHWGRSADPTTVAYRVLWNQGTHLAAAATTYATITALAIQQRIRVTADASGGGLFGRISSFGTVPAGTAALNIELVIGITAEGAYSWAITGTADAGTGTFNAGDTVNLPYGCKVTFHDHPDTYATGALWAIYIGPATDFITAALNPGKYRFNVLALDAAGNASATPDSDRYVRIMAVPDAVSAVQITLTAESEITVTWHDPAAIAGVNVYTNYNAITGLFEDYITDTELPYAQVAAGVKQWVFSTAATGRLQFRLRPYFSNGIEREDYVIYSFGFPATWRDLGESLANPTGLKATPTAGGTWLLEWDYAYRDGSTCSGFYVYRQATAAPFDFTADPYATVTKSTGTSISGKAKGPRLKHYSFTDASVETGTILLAVRAANLTTGVASDNVNYVSLVPDAVPPTDPGAIAGGAA